MSGGRPRVSASAALGHIDYLVSVCPGATPSHIARLAGVAISALPRARSGGRLEDETADRILAVRPEHVRLMPPPLVPPTVAKAHLRHLLAETGVAIATVARAIPDVSHQTVYNVLGDVHTQIKYRRHAAIVATTVDDVRGVECWCDRRPSITRLRALQANGWSLTSIGPLYGMNLASLACQSPDAPMLRSIDRQVTAVYEAIGDEPGPTRRSIDVARALGYFPPIYYDENMDLIEVEEVDHRAQDDARTTLCILGLTLERRSVAQIVSALGCTDREVSKARKTYGLAIRKNFDGVYEPYEVKSGVMALIRAAVKDVHYRTTLDVLDAPGSDYVALLGGILSPESDGDAEAA